MNSLILLAALVARPTAPALECTKVDVDTACYVMKRNVETPLVDQRTLSYVALQDSRCPTDVDCVWAGYVRASFQLKSTDGSAQSFSLLLDPRYSNTNFWVDPATGLTVILDAVQRHPAGPVPAERDLVKVTVGYDLKDPADSQGGSSDR